jgi:hypothetical protein
MPQPSRRGRVATALALAVTSLLVLAGAASAQAGLQNPSFEDGLTGWTADILAEGSHDVVPAGDECVGIGDDDKRAICVIEGSDEFHGSPVAVTPLHGTKMVRLGGPFTFEDEEQFQDRYQLRQSFVVDPANPVLDLNYNAFLYDEHGFDELRFTVALNDEHGVPITDVAQETYAVWGDYSLKTTGWRSTFIDLSGYENETVHLTVTAGTGNDPFYGFWAYLDAGHAPSSVVAAPTFQPPSLPGTSEPVPLDVFADPASGQSFATISPGHTALFPSNGCMPLGVSVRIDADVAGVSLVSSYARDVLMDEDSGVWRGTLNCARTGELSVQYTAGGQTFVVPIGGVAVIEPSGVVYDRGSYDAAVAGGVAPEQARAAAAIEGATVRLQRRVGGTFRNVLAGEPELAPRLNPQVTGAGGRFRWETGDGEYRVVVSKPGYETAVSGAVSGLAGLHVGLAATPGPVPTPPVVTDGGGNPPTVIVGPPAPPAKKAACAGLRGAKLAKCKRAEKLAKAIAACKKGKASKRALCIRRAKALSTCSAVTGKAKRRRCVARAKKIGRPAARPNGGH